MDMLEEQLMTLMTEDEPNTVPPLISVSESGSSDAGSVSRREAKEAKEVKEAKDTSLSADAPAFVPAPLPHIVSVFDPATHAAHALKCDLTQLCVGDLRSFTERRFGLEPGSPFALLVSGNPIPAEPSAKAIDLGLSNGSVVVYQAEAVAPAYTTPPTAQQRKETYVHPPHPHQNQVPSPAMQRMVDLMMSQVSQSPTSASGSSASCGSMTPNSSLMTPHKVLFDTPDVTPEKMPRYTPIADPYTSAGSAAICTALLTMGGRPVIEDMLSMVLSDFIDMVKDHNASKVVLTLAEAVSTYPAYATQLLQAGCLHMGDAIKTISGSEVLVQLVAAVNTDAPDSYNMATMLMKALSQHAIDVCCTIPGRKLAQMAVVKYPDDKKISFYRSVCQDIVAIALDQCGCITIQRMYDYALTQSLKQVLRSTVSRHIPSLICDPYGNYVLQHFIKDNKSMSEIVVDEILTRIRIVKCATDKYGSNVIEKCLAHGSERAKTNLILSLCDRGVIESLIKDGFGNYVIQTAVEHSPAMLIDHLRSFIEPVVESSPYSYRIEGKLQRRLKKRSHPAQGAVMADMQGHQHQHQHQQQHQHQHQQQVHQHQHQVHGGMSPAFSPPQMHTYTMPVPFHPARVHQGLHTP
eukprot:TRINITY_DN5471_c2_g3_i1.p1 TRINITY_DN5471_c2_g3~~TRINITY_DN5471_c2_g3_i1.p1  ORF type:complete len:659 (+),score=270.39 TRINITY_DN5471_c2_g3_i1:77-1978(+)